MKREIQPEFLHGGDKQVVSHRAPIRHAATLLLVDWSGQRPRLLTGTRKKTMAFMPGLTVFPGGAIDADDAKMNYASDLSEETMKRLQLRASSLSIRAARALAMAAIRETFEETGALLGIKNAPANVPGQTWQPFADHAVTPDLQSLQLVARAITPPYRPRRFDTRFFMADSRDIAVQVSMHQETDLEDVSWLTLDEIFKKPLAFITKQVLTDLAQLFEAGANKKRQAHFPFYYARGKKYFCETIG